MASSTEIGVALKSGVALDNQGVTRLLRQSGVVFAGAMALNVCGFLFQMLASRKLGVESYGVFYALLSVVMIAGLPGAILSPVIARYAAEFRALHDDEHVRGLVTDVVHWVTVAAIFYIALGFVVAVPLGAYLRVPAWGIPVATAIAAVWLTSTALRAIAQGTQRFNVLSLSNAAEGAAKVIGLWMLLILGFGLGAGLLGVGIGAACGLIIAAWALSGLHDATTRRIVRYDWHRIARSTAAAASVTLATTLIGTLDVVLVKHFFNGYDAGLYSAAALGGKVLFYSIGFVSMIVLPGATDRHARGERTRGLLFLGLAAVAVVACAAGILLVLFGSEFLRVLVGPSFEGALPLLLPYAAAMTLLGLTSVMATYGIATHRIRFALPLAIGCSLTLLSVAFIHPALVSVAVTVLVGNAATTAAVAAALIWK